MQAQLKSTAHLSVCLSGGVYGRARQKRAWSSQKTTSLKMKLFPKNKVFYYCLSKLIELTSLLFDINVKDTYK